MGWQTFYVFRFDLGPVLQGQTRTARLKLITCLLLVAYNLLIIGLRGLQSENKL